MKSLLPITFFILIILCFSPIPKLYAATDAEASLGYEEMAAGKYDISDFSSTEREWFYVFLNGNLLATGWEDISADILMNTHADERDQLRRRLDELGYKIGREWCKDNEDRKIHTSMLKKWGKDLKKTASNEPEKLGEVIGDIDQEVDALLN